MQRLDDDIFDLANESTVPVVRRYAAKLAELEVTSHSFRRATIVQELIRGGIPESAANDITDAFRERFKRGSLGVFWDLENVQLSATAPSDALELLKKGLHVFGDIAELNVYVETSLLPPSVALALQDGGARILHMPHNFRKETADKSLIVDACWFALTRRHAGEDPVVCIISGDSDFSPLLAKLRMHGIRTIVISSVDQHVRSLRQQATHALRWPTDFITNPSRASPQPMLRGGASPPPPPSYVHTVGRTPPPRSASVGRPAPSAAAVPDRTQSPQRGGTLPSPSPSDSAAAAAKKETDASQASPPAAPVVDGQFEDLLQAIDEVKLLAGESRVLRSEVGVRLKRLNPLVTFRELSQRAEAAGLVTLGGQMGGAWIAKRSDVEGEAAAARFASSGPVIDDEDELDDAPPRVQPTSLLSTAGSGSRGSAPAATAASPQQAHQGRVPPPSYQAATMEPDESQQENDHRLWYVLLRYSTAWPVHALLRTMGMPRKCNRTDIRLAHEDGFVRTAFGPFRSKFEAADWFQLELGHTSLRPRFTTHPEKQGFEHVSRDVMMPSAASSETMMPPSPLTPAVTSAAIQVPPLVTHDQTKQ